MSREFKPPSPRAARLAGELQANIARRKAQARARAGKSATATLEPSDLPQPAAPDDGRDPGKDVG